LPLPLGPDDRRKFALVDIEVDSCQRVDLLLAHAVAFGDVAQFDQRHERR
jgi:hypothetical protein